MKPRFIVQCYDKHLQVATGLLIRARPGAKPFTDVHETHQRNTSWTRFAIKMAYSRRFLHADEAAIGTLLAVFTSFHVGIKRTCKIIDKYTLK